MFSRIDIVIKTLEQVIIVLGLCFNEIHNEILLVIF